MTVCGGLAPGKHQQREQPVIQDLVGLTGAACVVQQRLDGYSRGGGCNSGSECGHGSKEERVEHSMRTFGSEGVSGVEAHRKGMLKQSENIVHRLFSRQITRCRPNTHIHQVRKLYENIAPSHTVYDVECPDQSFRKFTNDGQYLICFTRNNQDLIVYRHKWLSFCVKGEAADDQDWNLPSKSKNFDSYFSHLCTIPLAVGTEVICKDFFLSTENGLYGIFATSTVPQDNTNAASDGAVPGVPSTEKITIFLVSLADGRIADQRVFHDDFIHLSHNMGVFLYDDLLAVLSIRFQCIRIYQIRETGRFVDVRTIGAHCREDDELVLNSQAQEEASFNEQRALFRRARGLPHGSDTPGDAAWHPQWNVKEGQSVKQRVLQQHHRERRHNSGGSTSTSTLPVNSPHRVARPENDNVSGSSSLNEGLPNADLDLQYDNYFGGFFANVEDNAVSQVDDPSTAAAAPAAVEIGGRSNNRVGSVSGRRRMRGLSQQQQQQLPGLGNSGHLRLGGREQQQPSTSNNGSGGAFGVIGGGEWRRPSTSTLRASASNGGRAAIGGGGGFETSSSKTTAYAPVDSAYPSRNPPEASSSGSGGRYSSPGPSLPGRSYTSTSGSSLDRHTTGGSSMSLSVRHRSTTTMSSTGSGSRSEGHSSRHNVTVSGGGRSLSSGGGLRDASMFRSLSNGSLRDLSVPGEGSSSRTGRGSNGSTSVHSQQGHHRTEYVVISRTDAAGVDVGAGATESGPGAGVDHQVCPEEPSFLPSGSYQGTNERRRLSRGRVLLGENGQSFLSHAGTSAGDGHPLDHHRWSMNGGAEGDPISSDHTLPSRPGGSILDSHRAAAAEMQAGPSRRAPSAMLSDQVNGNGRIWRPDAGVGAAAATRAVRDAAGNRLGVGGGGAGGGGGDGDGGGGDGGGVQSNPGAGVDAGENSSTGQGRQVLGGIKQRLLSFIFQQAWNGDGSAVAKAQRLKRFYYHFQHHLDLVMWKVQFLDRYRLLIKFGSVDGVLQRNSDTSHQTAFLAVFDLETTEILGFYPNSSDEFLLNFEHFCDHFRAAPRYPTYMNYISSYSNNLHVRDQLRKQRLASNNNKTGAHKQVVKRTLAWVPFNSQCQSPSVYFDHSLFHYDEKVISATDRHKPCLEHAIKFMSRRKPNSLKFRINPGTESGNYDGRTKRVASFLFHPVFPFAISVQQSFMQPPVVNFHFRK